MKSAWTSLLPLVRWICYLALAVVVAGFASMFILSASGACPTLGTGGIVCTTPFYKELATYGLTIVLLTVFTGLPGLLAIAGVFFLLHRIFLWRTRGASVPAADTASPRQPTAKPSFLMFLLKAFAVLMGVAFLLGIIGGIVGAGH